jgi:hypothetical protein
MPINNTHRLKAVEDKLTEAQKLITQAFSIMQYINADEPYGSRQHSVPTTDSSNAAGLYVGQYTTPTPVALQEGSSECQD